MKLRTLIDSGALKLQLPIHAGGPGSGCHGENCGRYAGGKGVDKTHKPKSVTVPTGYDPEHYAKQRQDNERFWRKQATSQVQRKAVEGGMMHSTLRKMVDAGQCDPPPAKPPVKKAAPPKAQMQPKVQPQPNPMGSPVQPPASPMAQPAAQPPISKANPALPTPESDPKKAAKPVGNGESKNASPIVQHVSNHMQDPVGATKEGFQDLQDKKLQYDQSRENMMRNLAPVKSIIQHVEQMHDLNQNGIPDELENNPDLNPAAQPGMQPGMNQSNKFGLDQGMPPQQVRSPGMNVQQRSPAMAPGAPKPTVPGGQQQNLNQQKLDPNNRPGMQQKKNAPPKPQKKVHVTVAGNAAMAARTGYSNLAMAVKAEALRTSNAACLKGMGACSDKMRAGGPGSGRRPGGGSNNNVSVGDRVRNTYGETGTVTKTDGTTLWVRNDKNTGNAESWHTSKTFKVRAG